MERRTPIAELEAFDWEKGTVNAIVEVPKGRRNKYNYNEEKGLFELSGLLPAGHVFPFDFGFIPSTLGEDGDPLDILILLDEPAFPGCLVPSRLLGVIEIEQRERDGETNRNDRIIAVYDKSVFYNKLRDINDLEKESIKEIISFFKSYNTIKGKEIHCLGVKGPERAQQLIEEGIAKRKKEKPDA